MLISREAFRSATRTERKKIQSQGQNWSLSETEMNSTQICKKNNWKLQNCFWSTVDAALAVFQFSLPIKSLATAFSPRCNVFAFLNLILCLVNESALMKTIKDSEAAGIFNFARKLLSPGWGVVIAIAVLISMTQSKKFIAWVLTVRVFAFFLRRSKIVEVLCVSGKLERKNLINKSSDCVNQSPENLLKKTLKNVVERWRWSPANRHQLRKHSLHGFRAETKRWALNWINRSIAS